MKKETHKQLTARQRAELKSLATRPDDAIDTSDAPELLDWSAAKRGLFYRPVKQQLTLRLDADVVAWFNQNSGMNLTPIFNQYLRHPAIPRLELLFGEAPGMLMYKWAADEENFAMPVRIGTHGHWQTIHPTTSWQALQTPLTKDELQVDVDHFYVDVNKQ